LRCNIATLDPFYDTRLKCASQQRKDFRSRIEISLRPKDPDRRDSVIIVGYRRMNPTLTIGVAPPQHYGGMLPLYYSPVGGAAKLD
jgi:hypothetical protein